MIPTPTTPPNPVWIAVYFSAISIVVTIVGWFVVNELAKRRERKRDGEVREHAAATGIEERKRNCRAFIAEWFFELKMQTDFTAADAYEANAQKLTRITELMMTDFRGDGKTKFVELVNGCCRANHGGMVYSGQRKGLVNCLEILSEFLSNHVS